MARTKYQQARNLFKEFDSLKHSPFIVLDNKTFFDILIPAIEDVFMCCEYDGERDVTEAGLIKTLESALTLTKPMADGINRDVELRFEDGNWIVSNGTAEFKFKSLFNALYEASGT